MAYLHLSEGCVREIVSRLNRSNIYSAGDRQQIKLMVCSMIDQLVGYDIEGVREI